MSNIEIIDRRHNKEHHVEPVKVDESVSKGEWQDVAYLIVLSPQPDGSPVLLGRAAGLRADGVPFMADVLLAPRWEPGYDWTAEAKKRLDTFLGCECTSANPCAVHKMYLQQWPKADMQRCSFVMQSPLPRVLELIIRNDQERARQQQKSQIVVPR